MNERYDLALLIRDLGSVAGACCSLALMLAPAGSVRAADPVPAPRPVKTYEVETHRDIAYYDGRDADSVRHTLDLFVPKGKKDFPVIIYAHGGGWSFGDKSVLGRYSAVGACFARHGVGAAFINYRLSPWVQHPEHIKDVARAFAWTHKNIGKYGGRNDQMFVSGHSAGGHLVALLATDESYLKAEGFKTSDIKGVIPVSGVFRIPEINVDMKDNGKKGQTIISLKGIGSLPDIEITTSGAVKGLDGQLMNLNLNALGLIFGNDPKKCKEASPISHVRAGLPPFLIFYADNDLPTLPGQAEEFAEALKEKKCDVQLVKVKDRRHINLAFNATTADDPVAGASLEFIRKHAR